jgi:predicted dehydrogenase
MKEPSTWASWRLGGLRISDREPRHPLGWDQTFVHELAHMLEAIAGNGAIVPYGATFEDGYRAAVVCDAIAASTERGSRIRIEYAGVEGGR